LIINIFNYIFIIKNYKKLEKILLLHESRLLQHPSYINKKKYRKRGEEINQNPHGKEKIKKEELVKTRRNNFP
jgi:hypothetical protein